MFFSKLYLRHRPLNQHAGASMQTSPNIERCTLRLYNVDGSLTTLSAYRGFRRMVQHVATEMGITGTIHRYHHRDLILTVEGSPEQSAKFEAFIVDLFEKKMVERIEE